MEVDRRIKVQPLGHSILPTSPRADPLPSALASPLTSPVASPHPSFIVHSSMEEPPPLMAHSKTWEAEVGHESSIRSRESELSPLPSEEKSNRKQSTLSKKSQQSKFSSVSNASKKTTLLKFMKEEADDQSEISDDSQSVAQVGSFISRGFKSAVTSAKGSQVHLTRSTSATSRMPFGRSKTITDLLLRDEEKIDILLRDEDSDSEDKKLRCMCNAVFYPHSLFVKLWHTVTAMVVIYIIIIVLIGIGFSWYKIPYGLYVFNYFIDGYCWVDMAVSFNTGYVHSGHLIMDRKKIAKHYLAFWFWIDLMANVPWEGILMVDKSNRKAVKFVKWLKLPRLLRIGRLRKVLKANARYLNVVLTLFWVVFCMHMGACMWVFIVDPCSAYYDEEPFSTWSYRHEVQEDLVARHKNLGWECLQSNIFQVYCQALQVSAASLLGVDRLAFLGYASGGGASSSLLEEVSSKAQELVDTLESAAEDLAAARVRALKLVLLRGRYPLSLSDEIFASSILAKWYGLNTQVGTNTFALSHGIPMDIFGTLMLLLGLYLQGSLFANLTKIIVCKQEAERKFRQAHDEVQRELDVYGPLIPEEVQERIKKHFEFKWVNQAFGPLQLLNPDLLSHSLRSELALCLYRDSVSKVEFLRGAPVAILTRVCLHLEAQYYMVHDVIYRRGEPPTGFYVVDKGKVMITGKVTAASLSESDMLEVGAGEHFGVGAVLAALQDRAARHTGWGRQDSSMMAASLPLAGGFDVLNRKSAFAATVCQLLWLPLEAFQEICEDHPKFFKDLTHPAKVKALETEGRATRFRPTRGFTLAFDAMDEEDEEDEEDDEEDYDECYANLAPKKTLVSKDVCIATALPGEVPQDNSEEVSASECEAPTDSFPKVDSEKAGVGPRLKAAKAQVQIRATVEEVDAGVRKKPGVQFGGSTVESFDVEARAKPGVQIRSTVETVESVHVGDLDMPDSKAPSLLNRSATGKSLNRSATGKALNRSATGKTGLFRSETGKFTGKLPPLPGSGAASPFASSELQEQVTSLEQSVQSQSEKIEKALKLIQELLDTVPDPMGALSNGKIHGELAISLL